MKLKSIKFPLLLIIFTISLDFLIGLFAHELYFSKSSKKTNPLIYSFTSSNDDIVIFGSSRAKHHYNAKLMQDTIGLDTYNFGSGGQNIYFHNLLLKSILQRSTPKIAILELMSIDFEVTPSEWNKEKLDILLPLSTQNKLIDEELSKIDDFHDLKTKSKIYPFNSKFYSSIQNNYFTSIDHFNGFVPINGNSWRGDLNRIDSTFENIKFDEKKIEEIYDFLELCIKNNIDTYIFISPTYKKYLNKSEYHKILRKIQKKYKIKVVNFLNHPEFIEDSKYFKDPLHLNEQGANIFTEMVIDTLNKESELLKRIN
ncbi:MAG: hypothetical protein COA32_13100 [Fluviicola sp.]|nr:MAG: hypothetical protein COA32_13100 [Fluviicola sp.]